MGIFGGIAIFVWFIEVGGQLRIEKNSMKFSMKE
jgi:hypothetical protein